MKTLFVIGLLLISSTAFAEDYLAQIAYQQQQDTYERQFQAMSNRTDQMLDNQANENNRMADQMQYSNEQEANRRTMLEAADRIAQANTPSSYSPEPSPCRFVRVPFVKLVLLDGKPLPEDGQTPVYFNTCEMEQNR